MNNIQLGIDPQSVPGFVLWEVSKLWQHQLNAVLRPFGLGSTEFVLLGHVVRQAQLGRSATATDLVHMTKVDRMTASQTIRSLEKKKLLKRIGSPEDKRTFRVNPTPEGVKLADDALGKVITSHVEFFAPLTSDLDQYLALSQKLIVGNSNARNT